MDAILTPMHDVSQILSRIEQGDPSAADELLPLIYDELRRLAATKLAQESPGQTLQATALVHEAYLRLASAGGDQHWDSRRHFFSAAAEAMRRILVERARRKNTQKRGGHHRRLDVEVDRLVHHDSAHRLMEVNEALEKLAVQHPPVAEVVKLRYFAGLTLEESASLLGVSDRTAYRYWSYARAWLYDEIRRQATEGGDESGS